jgi:hypothetical protein
LFQDTTAEGFRIHEALNSIIDKITGTSASLYSEYLGRTDSQVRTYADDGCGSAYGLFKGVNIRGYLLSAKQNAMSLMDWWTGGDPIFCLGLGYETIIEGGLPKKVIIVEKAEAFFDPTPSIDIPFAENITRRYDLDSFYKSVTVGFSIGSILSGSGIDDPQTQRTWYTRFKTIGNDISQLSSWFAGSYGIEETRRQQSLKLGDDWRIDNNDVVIALNKTTMVDPELDENFDSITNLLNQTTRYNVRLSATRCFLRWLKFLSGCLQIGVDNTFKFASGEGNYDMTTELKNTDCEYDAGIVTVDEKGDFAASADYLYTPGVYEVTLPMEHSQYATITANKKKAIRISPTDNGFITCFILNMSWLPVHGRTDKCIVLIK